MHVNFGLINPHDFKGTTIRVAPGSQAIGNDTTSGIFVNYPTIRSSFAPAFRMAQVPQILSTFPREKIPYIQQSLPPMESEYTHTYASQQPKAPKEEEPKPEGGRRMKKKDNVHAVLFDKSLWTVNEANAWLKKHNHRPIKKVHITTNMLRYRLTKPQKYKKYRIFELPGTQRSIKFVLEY